MCGLRALLSSLVIQWCREAPPLLPSPPPGSLRERGRIQKNSRIQAPIRVSQLDERVLAPSPVSWKRSAP
jgi:hypothetical protein